MLERPLMPERPLDTPLLTVEHLSFSYGRTRVLDDISFVLPAGSCTALLGNNGCGKTTLLSVLAGVKKPGAGRLLFAGQPLRRPFSDHIGYVPQDDPLLEELNGLDNLRLRFPGSAAELKRRLAMDVYAPLELQPLLTLPVRRYSGGMKRRLTLACAMLSDPPLLLLDEPCGALDLTRKAQIRACLAAYRRRGGTLLLSTHEEGDLALCGRILLLQQHTLRQISPETRGEALLALLSDTQASPRFQEDTV